MLRAKNKYQHYQRFQIASIKCEPRVKKPFPFLPVVKKIGLAKLLAKEIFHLNLKLIQPTYRNLLFSRPCIYGVFGSRFGGFAPIVEKCTGCLRCVQEFPSFCEVKRNPEFNTYGDSYWVASDPKWATTSPYHIVVNESENGKIPVRGMGYKGSFSDEGWDTIWTDMSEIVRPTRDGIYGREFISTKINIGSKSLDFVDFGDLTTVSVEVPLPIIFDHLPLGLNNKSIQESIILATNEVGTRYITSDKDNTHSGIPLIQDLKSSYTGLSDVVEIDLVEVLERQDMRNDEIENIMDKLIQSINTIHEMGTKVLIRYPFNDSTISLIQMLEDAPVDGYHFYADYHGTCFDKESSFIIDAIRRTHRFMVEKHIRDKYTVVVSGGIILAEHVPKAIICGADLVAIDTSILVALQMSFDGEIRIPKKSTIIQEDFDIDWGRQRLVNLLSAWYNQLLEILSAMGMRDVRRLRGDTGRAIFKEDIEREAFADIKRRDL